MGRMLPLVVGVLFLLSDRHSFDECQRQQAIAAQRCFYDTHMQEPNIPPLFQTISKAESLLSFLETKHLRGLFPIRPHMSPEDYTNTYMYYERDVNEPSRHTSLPQGARLGPLPGHRRLRVQPGFFYGMRSTLPRLRV